MATTSQLILKACERVGLETSEAQIEVSGQEGVYQVADGVTARLFEADRRQLAAKQIELARWLIQHGVAVVEPLAVEQPVEIASAAITFWHALPKHRRARPHEVSAALKRLHAVPTPLPQIAMGNLEPFDKLESRVEGATTLRAGDQEWLRKRLDSLRAGWNAGLPPGLGECIIHGDPWMGSFAVSDDGIPRLLKIERCSIGRPEWDLTSNAIKYTSTHGISADEYRKFAEVYGFDVTQWDGYALLRDIREFRMASHLAEVAANDPSRQEEAQLRVDCLRGRLGPRPWNWTDYVGKR